MSILFKPIEVALNAALHSDPETQEKWRDFNGRIIAITVQNFASTCYIQIDHGCCQLSNTATRDADLHITANSYHLLKLIREPDHLFSSDIDIHGDVQFARQLQDCLNTFDFDWEAQIAAVTGDTLAYPIAQVFRQSHAWFNQSRQSLQRAIAEYLKEEATLLPDKSMIEPFLNDIDVLYADLERLEARIKRLSP